MFKTNDYFIYSSRGVCRIDDICDKKVNDTKRTYYVFHPVTDLAAKIMIPVDSKKAFMRAIISPEEATEIIDYFSNPELIDWNENKKLRDKEFDLMMRESSASKLACILKVLLLRKLNADTINKKFADTDNRLLQSLQQLLYNELAIVLATDKSKIENHIMEHLHTMQLA